FLMVREGSVTRDLAALLPLVDPRNADRVGFVTDDKFPHDLLGEGGVDHLVRLAIAGGADPAYAVRCASYNNALQYRLPRRGAVAPGYFADLAVVGSLDAFDALRVYKDGVLVAEGGRLTTRPERLRLGSDAVVRDTVRLPRLAPESFDIPVRHAGARA